MQKKLPVVDTRTPNVVYLRGTTWVGSSVCCAEHWYGRFAWQKTRDVDVEHELTQEEADRLNVGDDWATYKPGDMSTRFFSLESMIDAARATWKLHFPEAKLLILGDPGTHEPQQVIDGPSRLMALITTLWQECEELGWWDGGHEPECEVLYEEWKRIWHAEVE